MNEIPSPNDNKEKESTYFEGVGVSGELISEYMKAHGRLEMEISFYNCMFD